MDKHWLTIIIVLLIVAIIFDGIRRMRRARQNVIKMALKPVERETDDREEDYGSEFPNGGARASSRRIDLERIKQARNKYNFGSSLPAWRSKIAEKISEQTSLSSDSNETLVQPKRRIEPSMGEADPLLDGISDSVFKDTIGTNNMDCHRETIYERSVVNEEMSETAKDLSGLDEIDEVDKRSEESEKQPVQASLNLVESVPMLMDTFEDELITHGKKRLEPTFTQLEEDDNDDVAVLEREKEPEQIQSVGTRIERHEASTEQIQETYSANKPRYESKYVDHSKQVSNMTDVLVIHVKAPKGEFFYGNDLLEAILDNGLRFGSMDIFHRHAGEDGEGPILFSMANMVKPGIFDLHTFEQFTTVGVSFFLTLPVATGKHMEALDILLATAKSMASILGGELNDEHRSVLTRQTIEHYRERIRDFSRRQQLEKNKV